MDRDFIQARIDATKAQIAAYEAAVVALASDSIQSYTIDSGQTRQTVTRQDLSSIQRVIDSLYNRCATLQARLQGGATYARPGW